jgi:excisionase family DNA binding protein
MTIKQAAKVLGVAEVTLRRWDEAGKFRARRHPMNNYRVYAEREVLRLRDRIWP